MLAEEAPVKLSPPAPVAKRIARLLLIALLAEVGYAVLNLSTMPVYLAGAADPVSWGLPNGRNLGPAVIGLVLVAFLLSEAVFKSPMGHLADKYGPKRLMLLGPAITTVTALLTLAVPHNAGVWEVLALIVLRVFDGIGAAMLWPAAFAVVGDSVEDHERQQAMSLLNLCYMLGIALAFPIGGIVNDLAGVRWASLLFASVLFAATVIAVWKYVPAKEHTEHQDDPQEIGIKEFLSSMRQIPQFLILAVVTFAGIGFPMAIFKLFPIDEFRFSETQVGALIFPGAIVMAIASVPMSKLGERIGRTKAVHVGMLLCAVGISVIGSGAFIPPMRQPWILAAGGIPVGIGFLLAIPAWMASVSDINPARRGVNLGAVMTAQGLGAIIGAPIGSAMYEKLKPLGHRLGLGDSFAHYSPFVGCAICITIGWLLSLKILREPT